MKKTIDESSLKDVLESPKNSSGNQIRAVCPFCHNDNKKFFINRHTQLWDCKNCGEKGNLFKLLKHLGRLELITDGRTIEMIEKLPPLFIEVMQEVETTEPVDMPIGFSNITHDIYLESRGFADYSRYPVGVAIDIAFKNFIIFQVFEDGVNKGFLARNKASKSEIDRMNTNNAKNGSNVEILRWNNSKDDFSKLIYGIDEITSETRTVVIVEGVFGKIRCDRFIDNNGLDLIKCVSVFGSKISAHQIVKLLQKGVSNIILLFDADAVDKIRMYSYELLCYFKSVKVGIIKDGEDIDDFTDADFVRVIIDEPVSVHQYSNSVIKCNLKL